MNKLLLGGAVAAMIAAGAAFAQAGQPALQPGPHGRMMMTENRADVAARVQKMFARLDTDRDGFVSKAEMDAFHQQRADRMEKRAERFDPSKMFDRLDANHDGKITQAEAEAAHSQRLAARGGQPAAHAAGAGHMFDMADTNKDGVVTRAEFDAAAAQMKAHMQRAGMPHGLGGQLFATADANKDGKVSLAEAQALALQHFDRMDLNHDGKLSPEERQQARQQFRAQHKPS